MKKRDVILMDKNSIFIDKRAKIGANVIIYENNRIDGNSVIEENVTIFPNSFVSNSIIGKGTKIYSSHIENSKIGNCSMIGPFSFIRSSSKIGNFVKIGAFCEIKNSVVGDRSKIGRMTALEKIKMGVFCNFLGMSSLCGLKFGDIEIGDRVFVGQNVFMNSPKKVENDSKIYQIETFNKE